jgi:MYXO-CTERM domain-containing protein
VALTAAGNPTLRVHNGAAGTLIADAIHVYGQARYNDGSAAASVELAPRDGILLVRTSGSECVPAGGGGAGGGAPNGGAGAGAANGAGANAGQSEDDGGCGCRAAPHAPSSVGVLAWLGPTLLVVRRRRRRAAEHH